MDDPVIRLRCQGGEGEDAAFVIVPVARELWEEADEVGRDAIRDLARRELQSFIRNGTGTLLPDDYVNSLPVTVEEPPHETHWAPTESEVVFVGGPEDGSRVTVTGERPPPLIRLPIKESPSALLECLDQPYQGIPIANYGPITDELGFWSRTDDGAWRYEYRGQ